MQPILIITTLNTSAWAMVYALSPWYILIFSGFVLFLLAFSPAYIIWKR